MAAEHQNLKKVFAGREIAYSFKIVLQYFLNQKAEVKLLQFSAKGAEAFVILDYKGVGIVLRSRNNLLFSVLNSYLAVSLSFDKYKMYEFLKLYDVPTPKTWVSQGAGQLEKELNSSKKYVIKPKLGAHGDGVSTNISNGRELRKAIAYAKKFHPDILMQEQVSGDEYRLLCLNYKIVAATRRHAPVIIGDGHSSLGELINQENAKRIADFRANNLEKWQEVHVSGVSREEVLRANGSKFLNKVPQKLEEIKLFGKGNTGLGGLAEDVTAKINPEILSNYSRLLKTLDLPICGIDIISSDITAGSLRQTYVIEINTRPGLIMHQRPHVGQNRDVGKLVAEAIYEKHRAIAKNKLKW